MSLELDVVVDAHAQVGEGSVWDASANCLYWVDIERGELHCHGGGEDRVIAKLDAPLGASASAGMEGCWRQPDGDSPRLTAKAKHSG